MDPYSSPYITPNSSPHNPFPHTLLRTRQNSWSDGLGLRLLGFRVKTSGFWVKALGFRFWVKLFFGFRVQG